jgi:hypothetical protein
MVRPCNSVHHSLASAKSWAVSSPLVQGQTAAVEQGLPDVELRRDVGHQEPVFAVRDR